MVQQEKLYSHTQGNNVKTLSFTILVTQAYCPPVIHYYINVSTTEILIPVILKYVSVT